MTTLAQKTAAVTSASANGFLTVASTVGFTVGAFGWLYKTGVTSQYCQIESIPSATQIGVRFVSSEPFNYGRSNVVAFTGGSCTFDQPAQLAPQSVEDSAGTTAARPATPNIGQMYFDTTLGIPVWYNSTAWVDATGTPV